MKFVKKENQMPNTTCSETVNVIPCHKRGYSIFNYRFSMSRVTHECIIFLFLKQLSNLRKQTYIYDTLLVYIYFACLSVVVSVSNKRQNGWSDRAQNLEDLTWPQSAKLKKIMKLVVRYPISWNPVWRYFRVNVK